MGSASSPYRIGGEGEGEGEGAGGTGSGPGEGGGGGVGGGGGLADGVHCSGSRIGPEPLCLTHWPVASQS